MTASHATGCLVCDDRHDSHQLCKPMLARVEAVIALQRYRRLGRRQDLQAAVKVLGDAMCGEMLSEWERNP